MNYPSRLNVAVVHSLDPDQGAPDTITGIALLGGDVIGRSQFSIHTWLTEPEDMQNIPAWLEARWPRAGIVAGHAVGRWAALLDPHGSGFQDRGPIVDLARGETDLRSACQASRIDTPCPDSDTRFIDWAFGQTDRLVHALEMDAIATWRLAMARLPFSTIRLQHAFDHWLPQSRLGASFRHIPVPTAA